MASVLHTFNVVPALDEYGKPLGKDLKMTTGLVS